MRTRPSSNRTCSSATAALRAAEARLRQSEELASLQERANKVINEIAEKEKFDLILHEATYASPRIDITDKVIKALADK